MIEDYQGRVAVITGGASGIGKAIAQRACAKGMKVVISDVEEDALVETEEELRTRYRDVISVVADVSKLNDIEALAQKTIDAYGSVHLLCNNAGIGATRSILQSTLRDYQWVLDVDLWGVIYGMSTFLPIMLKQNDDGHIVNTSSGAGVTPSNAAYGIAKCGVTALSEMCALELKAIEAKVGVSALVPGIVNTNIITSGRNRPDELKNPDVTLSPEAMKRMQQMMEGVKEAYHGPLAMLPGTVADIMFHGIENNALYIFTDLADEEGVKSRTEQLLRDADILRRFAEESELPKEHFYHKGMGQGLKNKYVMFKH